jgi:ribosomal protein L13E
MQPAEPPADEVLEVQERLTAARMYRNDAARLLQLLRREFDVAGDVTERRTHLGIEVDLAERRLARWDEHVERLQSRARALGLTP